MEKIKVIGMVHLKGVNDKAYAEYLKKLTPVEPPRFNPIAVNRW